ncbi:alkylation response protein AidB-like acyl-CoA dehydrogenase [Roseivirga ehrenbergii]|uniref:Acyl-CoA dehydrogenase n=1 Tax=Roseivirga ehrenbergii (strain DSM 102268 / JCM 13514 / KCTC 12282 / NCIMB 14502 / KMM 6017) TaxID=279360 RepID=A0A150X7P9_ROSEK|nr:acyl-CoA dehydrogenase family protein [Roseivirga ehrenbergii]KYG74748.1 acyl-CoA dehydrogenase [Roseivirga ehrenbergii]TCL13923.1 alkylation response protein AidB-like acyl-CoA dehydrogenase [Roseivirga ehrenbergii]
MTELFATDKLKALYPKVKQFIEEELYPSELYFLKDPWDEVNHILKAKREKAKELGLWAPYLSEEEGGAGLTLTEFGQLSELLGRTPLGHYVLNCQAPDIGNIELMHQFASAELKEKYLAPLMKGEIRSCFSMTEPDFAGSNPVNMGTTAVLDGDEFIINGHKWFTTAADGAAFAIVMAVTNPDAEPHKRASMIVVPTDTPGFELTRNIPIMGDMGEGYLSHAEIHYVNCRVPKSNLIGEMGSGFMLAQQRLGPGRIHHCMRWIGICERAFDMMCSRAASRELRDGRMLGHQQTVQNWIAESRAEINASRYMVLHAAQKIDNEGSKGSRLEISTIKFYVADVLMKVLDRAIQVHGALGITDDTLLSFWYRHERGARIYDGPDEVHKASLAKAILKGYGM